MEKRTKNENENRNDKKAEDEITTENLEEEIMEFKRLMLLQKIVEIRLSDPNYYI
jgi:hypothetical protein